MKMTEEGLALLRRCEGFRGEAYRDAVGVWTIGYGHTSMAGPPAVTPGLRMSADEAADVLARDVSRFADGVAKLVTVPVCDNQFSALVSFAYNVGLGAFKSSSVLKAVNEGNFAAVPHRLSLWVKAGGKTLPGLVKRRALEGALFATADAPQPPPKHESKPDAPDEKREASPPGPAVAEPALARLPLWSALLTALIAAVQNLMKPKKEGV